MSTVENIINLPLRFSERERGGRVRRFVRRHPLVAFFVLAYALSWSLSAVYLFTRSGPAILSCGPFLAAAVVLGLTSVRQGIKDLFRSMRQSWMLVVVWGVVAAFVVAFARRFRAWKEAA
jgi:hypothetical protein